MQRRQRHPMPKRNCFRFCFYFSWLLLFYSGVRFDYSSLYTNVSLLDSIWTQIKFLVFYYLYYIYGPISNNDVTRKVLMILYSRDKSQDFCNSYFFKKILDTQERATLCRKILFYFIFFTPEIVSSSYSTSTHRSRKHLLLKMTEKKVF